MERFPSCSLPRAAVLLYDCLGGALRLGAFVRTLASPWPEFYFEKPSEEYDEKVRRL